MDGRMTMKMRIHFQDSNLRLTHTKSNRVASNWWIIQKQIKCLRSNWLIVNASRIPPRPNRRTCDWRLCTPCVLFVLHVLYLLADSMWSRCKCLLTKLARGHVLTTGDFACVLSSILTRELSCTHQCKNNNNTFQQFLNLERDFRFLTIVCLCWSPFDTAYHHTTCLYSCQGWNMRSLRFTHVSYTSTKRGLALVKLWIMKSVVLCWSSFDTA